MSSYLYLPIKNGAEPKRVQVLVDGDVDHELDIELPEGEEVDFWAFMDLSHFEGDVTLKLKAPGDRKPGLLDRVREAGTMPGEEEFYQERYRPQFHFTSRRGWINDPNGCVYYDGEYHLFYQHNPYGVAWGNMHWGHAVSPDLAHWTELGEALYPDNLGPPFSGSAVVDQQNTAGFRRGEEEVIVCIYTAAGRDAPKPVPYTQCIAYSNDRGRSWTKYEDNPVLGHIVDFNRDLKVFWHEPTEKWIMALYLERSDYALFCSPNLKQWARLCDIEFPGNATFPDLFELGVDGDPDNTKWVFRGPGSPYLLGSFDGQNFTPEGGPFYQYAGGDACAPLTFNNVPAEDGRRIQITWLRQTMPGMPFNQMMTFPVELTLRTTEDGVRMFTEPVREIEKLHAREHKWRGATIRPSENLLEGITGELFEIRAKFKLHDADEFGFIVRGIPIGYNATSTFPGQNLFCPGARTKLKPVEDRIQMQILVDRTSIEIFGASGRVHMPLGIIPDDDNKRLSVFARGGSVVAESLEVYELKSAWEKD